MLNSRKSDAPNADFDGGVKVFRRGMMIALGLFGGTVMGGIVGLFVYANSRNPNVHDGVFAVIQIVGVLLGLGMGLIAARSSDAQDQLLEASQRAGGSMLKKYKPKPGAAGNSNVGQRVIGAPIEDANAAAAGEEYLKTLLTNAKQP